MKYYMNIEDGNIFDYTAEGFTEMLREAAELYDQDDDTNGTPWQEYYEVIEI